MRCFFNLINAHGSILDTEGVDATGVGELRAAAVAAIEDARDSDPSAAREWKGWRLEVTDTSGAVLLTISLDDLRPKTIVTSPLGGLVLLKCCELSEHLANVIPHELILST
jgi:hypothetical protein